MKKVFLIFTLTVFVGMFSYSFAKEIKNNDKIISNNLFSISVPEKLKGTYRVEKKDNGIALYHKESRKDGFGGFAFGIRAYKTPSDYAMMPGGRKIGELVDNKEMLYDMVLVQPTDVQHNYLKYPNSNPSYNALYELGEVVAINGVKGSVYYKAQGTKGENLYKKVLEKHVTAIKEKWDSQRLENEDMSYMYNVIAKSIQKDENVLDKIGYIYYDVNADGIEELLIGEIADGDWKGIIYDMYTMVNRKPMHVVSGASRNRYYVCNDAFVCREYSSGSKESGRLVYFLTENSTELFGQVGMKYDAYENFNNPWFISYSTAFKKWDNVKESVYKERMNSFSKYKRFDYIPLSTVK